MSKWTPSRIKALKSHAPFACVTVFDYTSAYLADQAEYPFLLVGDSLGMTVLGHPTTLAVNMDMMLHHSAAAARGVQKALVISDLPFLSYQVSDDLAVQNAGRFLQEAGADGVKLEGGLERATLVGRMVQNGIPVCGHIGLTPQSVKQMGYHVQGGRPEQAKKLKRDALALQEAGAFSLVLEACPPDVAEEITNSLEIPTIGIGAGPDCDAQILVWHDLMGINPDTPPKFVKTYADVGRTMSDALQKFSTEVQTGSFPDPEHCYPALGRQS